MPATSTPHEARLKRALVVFAEAHRGATQPLLRPDRALVTALVSEFGGAVGATGAVPETELIDAAAELVLQDPEYGPGMRALLNGPPAQSFVLIETAAVITAVLLILQTHVRIERKLDGQWSILVLKKPTDTTLLTKLVSKLLPFLDKP